MEKTVKLLVDALTEIGAEISYLEQGYPFLLILNKPKKNSISIGDISSQYISSH